jgi:hypothetical protein
MNESEFENSLRSLAPAAVSQSLAKRVAAEMAADAVVVAEPRTLAAVSAGGIVTKRVVDGPGWIGWLRGLVWASGGAAVAVIILTARGPQAPGNTSVSKSASVAEDSTIFPVSEEPVESTDELIATDDEGLIYEDGSPQRQLRMTYIEHHTWTNPRTGAVIEMEVPREDIVLMPVAMQ